MRISDWSSDVCSSDLGAERDAILIAGAAGLVAGAMSMAAGEYVSVSSQADTEHADVDRERSELATDTAAERKELTQIYRSEEHTSELQSLMRISYAVFCLKKKTTYKLVICIHSQLII